MQRVRIIHWKPAEAQPLIEQVRASGFEPEFDNNNRSPDVNRAIRHNPPAAVAIDLSRLPSHGREMAVWLRCNKSTRAIPLVFVGGEPAAVEKLRNVLPDAVYSSFEDLPDALRAACAARVPKDAVMPVPMMERGAGKTAAEKLGIAANSAIALIDAPRDYAALLAPLPANVELAEEPTEPLAVTLWFLQEPEALLPAMRRARTLAAQTKLWFLWRKGAKNGLSQKSLREAAVDAGLVDYKICAVDTRWSAMLFARGK